ncbi:MAG: ketoacyl-ACP synthase III [Prevotella sp.]|nr:ketoacyl-ACP synthase III [Prevotella sp.]
MGVFIKDIAYYLPQHVVTNQEIVEEFPEWSVEKIAEKVGVCERRVADSGETATDLAIAAAEKLFASGTVKRQDIDFVLFCTQSPDYKLPSSACIMQDKLGLSTACGAFDFNLGCSGYEYGLAVAKGLIVAGIASNVLLLTGETYNKYIHPRDKGNRTIFGDAATATVVSVEGFAEIGEFCLGTDGSGAKHLIVETGGARFCERKNDLNFDESGNPISSDHLKMDGQEIFVFTLTKVPKMVKEILARNSLSQEDISLFVFHQANKYMLEHLRKKMKIIPERFFINFEHIGNTVSSTIPIALCDAREQGRLKGNVLLAGFGVGLSWGGVILQF